MSFLSFSNKKHAESFRNFVKNLVLDPKRPKLDQKSEIGHVRTCQDLPRRTSTYCKPAEILLSFTKSSVLLSKFIIFGNIICFIKEIYDFFIKSPALWSKCSIFYKLIGFTEQIYHFYKIMCLTKQIYRRQVLIAKPRFYF